VVPADGYRLAGTGELTPRVYDPNSPGRDDIELSMKIFTPRPGRSGTTWTSRTRCAGSSP